jgi:stage II sporulation protein D
MELLHYAFKNIYKIFLPFAIFCLLNYEADASEDIRVLLPLPSSRLNITIEKGGLYYSDEKGVECRLDSESDEIAELIKGNKEEEKRGPILIEEVRSRKSYELIIKDSITIKGIKGEYKNLILKNAGTTIEINGRFLRGDVEIRYISGTFRLINQLDVEDYLKYTISKEMNPKWEIEALKAQAVLARTYVLKKKYKSRGCLYDIQSSTIDQVYGSFESDYIEVIQAVSDTAGEVIKYRGEIIDALYHSCCGGKTSNSKEVFGFERPYLVSVECECRGECPYGKGWSHKIRLPKLSSILGLQGIESVYEENERVIIKSGKKISVFSKNSFREKIGFQVLKSSNFHIRMSKDEVLIEGIGFGHGVGLCQYGAKKMAEEGKNYREILYHYFKGTTIEKIY